MSTTTTRAALAELARLPLPTGWKVEAPFAARYIVISYPGASVTIDVALRTFRAGGYVTHGTTLTTEEYRARGWVARLHADAVAWLQANGTPRPHCRERPKQSKGAV